MKIGVVKHLNARPLTYGFEKKGNHSIFYENPSILKEELLKGNLDLALISSVECIRNEERLDYSLSVGVCSSHRVRSILFFENKIKKEEPILVDEGSRSSVALLKILYTLKEGKPPSTIPTKPEIIQEQIRNKQGSHLLFGDNALLATWDPEAFNVYDLGEWWNQETDLYFIFALWATPKGKIIEDQWLYSSLEYGLQRMDEIIENEKRFPRNMVSTYLQSELHYVSTEKDRKGFEKFQFLCKENNLL
jgi:chorismate dehydratase